MAGQFDRDGTVEVPPGLQPLIDKAIADLAARLSLDSADIEIVGAEPVEWRDSSLGCPQPGFQYLQVLSDGMRIELRVQDKIYSYHSGRGRDPFLCENPSK